MSAVLTSARYSINPIVNPSLSLLRQVKAEDLRQMADGFLKMFDAVEINSIERLALLHQKQISFPDSKDYILVPTARKINGYGHSIGLSFMSEKFGNPIEFRINPSKKEPYLHTIIFTSEEKIEDDLTRKNPSLNILKKYSPYYDQFENNMFYRARKLNGIEQVRDILVSLQSLRSL